MANRKGILGEGGKGVDEKRSNQRKTPLAGGETNQFPANSGDLRYGNVQEERR